MQKACGFLFGLSTISIVLMPSLVSSTISPGNTSRTYLAPILKNPQDSDEITQPSASSSSSSESLLAAIYVVLVLKNYC